MDSAAAFCCIVAPLPCLRCRTSIAVQRERCRYLRADGVRELMHPVSLLDPDLQTRIDALPYSEARVAVMVHAIRAQTPYRLSRRWRQGKGS